MCVFVCVHFLFSSSQSVMVTGSNSGIGKVTALEMAKRGEQLEICVLKCLLISVVGSAAPDPCTPYYIT